MQTELAKPLDFARFLPYFCKERSFLFVRKQSEVGKQAFFLRLFRAFEKKRFAFALEQRAHTQRGECAANNAQRKRGKKG